MEKCLDKCIRGSDYHTDEEDMANAAKFKREGYVIGSIHQNQWSLRTLIFMMCFCDKYIPGLTIELWNELIFK